MPPQTAKNVVNFVFFHYLVLSCLESSRLSTAKVIKINRGNHLPLQKEINYKWPKRERKESKLEEDRQGGKQVTPQDGGYTVILPTRMTGAKGESPFC